MEASSEPAVADEDLGGEDRKRAERLHGYLRSYFRNRPDRYRELGEILNSAKIPGTYYDYLADAYLRAVIGAAVGFIDNTGEYTRLQAGDESVELLS